MKRASIFSVLLFFSAAFSVFSQTIELENALLNNCKAGNTLAGYSGTGYVENFDRNGKITLHPTAEKGGYYDLYLGYELTASEPKPIVYTINGTTYSYTYPASPGKFTKSDNLRIQLIAGSNTIEIETGKNTTYNLDYVQLVKYERTLHPATELINPHATKETKELYNYFLSIYGKHIIAGQTEFKYCEFISGVTGRSPVICAFDFMDYTSNKDLNMDQQIDWAKKHNGIVAFQWHWRDPMTKSGNFYSYPEYENGTRFDAAKIFEPESPEYKAMMEDIDHIASQLKILQDNHIPVLWRPLHEATGNQWSGWFWWGTGGNSREEAALACKELWNVMYDRLVNYHGLNNLIWTWNTEGTAREDIWYPGDDKVDLLGTDVYNGTPNTSWEKRFEGINLKHEGKKMIAMTENGSVPDPQQLIGDGVPWLYFCTWSDMIKDQEQNPRSVLRRAFNDPYVITNKKLDVDTIPDPVLKPTLPDAFEAEESTLKGTLSISKVHDGYTGSGYVGGFSGENDELIFSINCHSPQEYDLYIGYHISRNWGDKYSQVSVNGGDPSEVKLAELKDDFFHETTALKINLKQGTNEIKISRHWGYYDIDYIRIPRITTGIDEITAKRNNVWADESSNLNFYLPELKSIQQITIINSNGQTVKSIPVSSLSENCKIACSGLSQGVYIIIIHTFSGKKTFKVRL